ncbi:hypothetical protein CCH79_00020625 [Gambusia affinis]|uniref:Protein phosphatase 1 regulatory subunit 35 C-terminal domain-containing protein n=1 Tax=Gambusia affinis TaxID=33528 RepID=A0A315VAF6_GAMAF|nr:hypothetical protein CCH79_00020625 [Gambusia affinis]
MDEYGEQHEPEVTEAPPSGPEWNSALRCRDSLGSRQILQQEAPLNIFQLTTEKDRLVIVCLGEEWCSPDDSLSCPHNSRISPNNHVSLFLVLQEMEFNSKKALQQTLLKSRRTKTEDEFLSQMLQDKLILAPLPSHCYKSAESPSLNFFITSELFRKKPLQQEEEPAKCKPSPMAYLAYSTFDLYKRQRCWEAIP